MKKIIFIVVMAFAPALFIKTYAQKPSITTSEKPGWHKISETNANFSVDKDEIYVIGNDNFKALKLKVTDAPIHIYKMTVVYEGDGADEEIATSDVPGEMLVGSESKVINLKGSTRDIKKVVFSYRTLGHKKAIETDVDLDKDHPADKTGVDIKKHHKAHVELWGLK